MTTSKLRLIHPCEILREEFFVPLEMTPYVLAMQLRVPAPEINDIVREKKTCHCRHRPRLARFFNSTAQFWLNFQTAYDLKIAENTFSAKINLQVPQLQAA